MLAKVGSFRQFREFSHGDGVTMTRVVRLSVFHHNRLFRECLVSVFSGIPGYQMKEVDPTDGRYLELIEQERPDVILVGLCPSGRGAVELCRHIREHVGTTKIILLARGGSEEHLYECFAAGVDGCLFEESPLAELQAAIETVLGGEPFCPPQLVYLMFQKLTETAHRSRWTKRVESVELTPRELEIVHLIAERLSNKEIAKRLCVSLYTVKNHVHNIVEKLQVKNRFEAVEYAHQRRWLKGETATAALGSSRR